MLRTRKDTLVVDIGRALQQTATGPLSLLTAGHAKHLVVLLDPVIIGVPDDGPTFGD